MSADGLTQENLPAVSLGNREGGLFIKINPPIYSPEAKEDTYMQFRLFDANTNETVNHVTYNITVNKDAITAGSKKPLVSDLFHAHDGMLTLKVEPTNESLSIFGDRDLPEAAYVADSGGAIYLKGPLLQEGGLYRFDVQISGIDNDGNAFAPDKAPKYETYLSMGDTFNFKNLDYEGQKFNTTLVSYYDRIDNFSFNSTTGEFSWSMPFDYNIQRLEENPILVHEEIKLPKGLFGSNTFNASVNGLPISGRSFAIDPFTSPNSMILHYLIDKNNLMAIAKQWQQGAQELRSAATVDNASAPVTLPVTADAQGQDAKDEIEVTETVSTAKATTYNTRNGDLIGTMDFTLLTNQPSSIAASAQSVLSSSPAATNGTSIELVSDTGGILASVLLSPSPIKMGIESSANINFTDMFSGESLNADVLYDLSILYSNGSEVIKKEGLIAKNSQDRQSFLFSAPGEYEMSLSVNGLQLPSGQKQDDTSPVDLTRNGIAKGSVLVAKE
ncbi:MAG: hypothetical protein ACRD8Z_10545 [Nitrososphaeraceae archaeon]